MGNKPQKIIVMKKFLLAVFMFLCITSMCCENNLREEKKILFVKIGNMGNDNLRSLEALEATYNNSCLTINFNVSLGQADVIIESEYGNTVYNSSLNIIEHEMLFIPLANLPSGTYYITILCNNGSAEGEFRIENN